MNPGPGTYQTPNKKSKQSGGKLYKKAEVINLKQEELPTPSPAEYTNFYDKPKDLVKPSYNIKGKIQLLLLGFYSITI